MRAKYRADFRLRILATGTIPKRCDLLIFKESTGSTNGMQDLIDGAPHTAATRLSRPLMILAQELNS